METPSIKTIAEYGLFTIPYRALPALSEGREALSHVCSDAARDYFFSPVAVSYSVDVPFVYYATFFDLFYKECPEAAFELPVLRGEVPEYLVVHSLLQDKVTRYSNIIYVPELFDLDEREVLDRVEIDFSLLPQIDFYSPDWLEALRRMLAELPRGRVVVFFGEGNAFLSLISYIFLRRFAESMIYLHEGAEFFLN